jgi:hypothetical protein
MTLPTGTLTHGGMIGGSGVSGGLTSTVAINQSIEWSIINLGTSAGAVTLAPGSAAHTIVGSATVAIGTSAIFRTRISAKDTAITYRIS